MPARTADVVGIFDVARMADRPEALANPEALDLFSRIEELRV
jgi:hypothetical protein